MNHVHPIRPANQSQQRRQRSLSNIYKDLIITKRDLIDLRQSIQQTIDSIKQSDKQLQRIHHKRRVLSFASAAPVRHAPLKAHPQPQPYIISPAHQADPQPKFKCLHCAYHCSSLSDLSQHKSQSHKICPKCNKLISQQLKDHLAYTCGQERFPCHECSLMIKKKDLNEHIRVCYFRECVRCRKEVYAPTLAYHVQICGREGTNHKTTDATSQQNKWKRGGLEFILPCCLVVKNDDKGHK